MAIEKVLDPKTTRDSKTFLEHVGYRKDERKGAKAERGKNLPRNDKGGAA